MVLVHLFNNPFHITLLWFIFLLIGFIIVWLWYRYGCGVYFYGVVHV